jgi:NarL family two-component system response regulator LiaR
VIRVVLVDDHAIVRQGLRMFLALDSTIEVVGEAESGQEAVLLVRELKPDVVLMDILMPEMDGVEATAAIVQENPATRVIAVTSSLDPRSVVGAVKAGASGYLPKTTEAEELGRAVHAVAQGQVQLAPEVAALIIQEMRGRESPVSLSEREIAILRLLVLGKTNREIGEELQIGEKSVKSQMSSLMPKLNVQSRTQAALEAVRLGLVSV